MAQPEEMVRGKIVDYDDRTQEMVIRVHYDDLPTMFRREYKEVDVRLIDSRPLSDKQRRNCYAMIREIAEWSGDIDSEVKEYLKMEFWASEFLDTAYTIFSLRDAPMSTVSAFQRYIARFMIRNEVPCKKPLISYVDDVDDYIYQCLKYKKCCVCGRKAELHHVDRVGMGRDRNEIDHEGMRALPLCRGHHDEAHRLPDSEFMSKYHLNGGIKIDKELCSIYKLKTDKGGSDKA